MWTKWLKAIEIPVKEEKPIFLLEASVKGEPLLVDLLSITRDPQALYHLKNLLVTGNEESKI